MHRCRARAMASESRADELERDGRVESALAEARSSYG